MEMGRFDRRRWGASWRRLFATHRLVHNRRQIRKIEISAEGDGAFAVVDIDTLWRAANGETSHWNGRVCKVYAKVRRGMEDDDAYGCIALFPGRQSVRLCPRCDTRGEYAGDPSKIAADSH